MAWRTEIKALAVLAGGFLALFFLPVASPRFQGAVLEALALARWYAREHVILCLVPAFFIAGAITVFVSRTSVMRYLGPGAPKAMAYGVASVSGTILAVCSCTILPLFAGIYRMGAGLGPAAAFLYSGPAINILAIILTARILGPELGIARAVGAVAFAVVIGLLMHLFFRKEEAGKVRAAADLSQADGRPLRQTALFIGLQVGILIFATWGSPEGSAGFWAAVYSIKWLLVLVFTGALAAVLVSWYSVRWWKLALGLAPLTGLLVLVTLPRTALAGNGALAASLQNPMLLFGIGVVGLSVVLTISGGEPAHWFESSWTLARQILPLLFAGVLAAGFFLGRPGHEGVIPSGWIASAVGGNSVGANLFASLAGALMYFATLTEVPILQGLLGAGMGKGPALALLLAGPALSLPNMLVIQSVMGTGKTAVFVALVILMATASGLIFGAFF
ncbi:MAG: permease [bacterium]|nr:MAG: permease [bacterium]